MIRWLLVFSFLATSACGPKFRYPYTKDQLGRDRGKYPARALVHYLGQNEADSGMCSLSSPMAANLGEDGVRFFIEALRANKIEPPLWRACIGEMFPDLPEALQNYALEGFAEAYIAYLDDLAQTPPPPHSVDKLMALHEYLLERPEDSPLPKNAAARLRKTLAQLRGRDSHLPTKVAQMVGEAGEALDLDAGIWQGKAVSRQTLESISDNDLLARMMRRLPSPGLRTEAKRRMITLKIAASPIAEVAAEPAAVLERLMQTGVNAITPKADAKVRARVIDGPAKDWRVVVHQDLAAQRAIFMAVRKRDGKRTILPVFDLKEILHIDVEGYGQPMTLCGNPQAFDPTPCLASSTLRADNPTATLDAQGRLFFKENLTTLAALELLEVNGFFSVAFFYGKTNLAALRLKATYERPQNLVLYGPTGSKGPQINADIFRVYDRIVIDARIDKPQATRYVAILETADATGYAVKSKGGTGQQGTTGSRGMDGSRGHQGTSAMCPHGSGGMGGRGGDGSSGGRGGNGGPGGQGGKVSVNVRCVAHECGALKRLAKTIFASEGGDGGPGGQGGPGGSGGQGGAGGSSSSCTVYESRSQYDSFKKTTVTKQVPVYKTAPAGMAGSRGSDGSRGPSGSPGAPGKPGSVQVIQKTWNNAQALKQLTTLAKGFTK